MVNRLRTGEGRFAGSRLDLESVPRLPAVGVRAALDDPLSRPYLFLWKLEGRPVYGVGEIAASVVIRRGGGFHSWPEGPTAELFEIAKTGCPDGPFDLLTLFRRLPRGGGAELLVRCAACDLPKRYLFPWERRAGRCRLSGRWQCRSCAGLRFASEGQRDRWGWGYPRQDPWDPYVFSSLEDAQRFLASSGA